jgi:hypothetical protein
MHVKVTDDSGQMVADVDAQSTCDGLAYFLASRKVDATATEASVAAASGATSATETVVFTERSWDGTQTLRQFKAEVH